MSIWRETTRCHIIGVTIKDLQRLSGDSVLHSEIFADLDERLITNELTFKWVKQLACGQLIS